MNEIVVSVICNTYNHEKYVRDALESFVAQKTNFEYEILVHDDASTDGTADIIREYEGKYPNLIKPIYQTENQYSKGVLVGITYQYPRAKGKYIALCEGDDYWIDLLKLQKQVDYMESHPDCTFCFTNGFIEDQSQLDMIRTPFIPYNDQDRFFYKDEDQNYDLNNSYQMTFVPTASFLYRKDTYMYVSNFFVGKCPTGDLRIRLYLTSQGYAHYICDKTCVYRQNVPESAMSRWKKYDRKKVYSHNELILTMLRNLDGFTDGKFHDGIVKIENGYIKNLLFSAASVKVLKTKQYKTVYDNLTVIEKMKFWIKIITPEFFIKCFRKLKNTRKGK